MSPLPDDLLDAGAYVPRTVGSVECIETHVSWVFRTGTEVFKVKRPVDFGFLDFRSIEARREACEAELTLNRRLAAGVYLDVVPVRQRADGRHHFGTDGEVVDWAVHMNRLDDDHRADLRVARGALDGDAIDRVAVRLAAFHAAARNDVVTAQFGHPDAIRRNVVENFQQTRAWVERFITANQADEIERWQLGFLRDREDLFEQRAAAGRVRDGHGDLRLEHVYLGADGSVTVIDCIEFNDRFRYADVCADLAFLSMDLAWHGRVDLAERLLAHYARESDDYDLYPLVDFYESYRAYVRGKIAGFLATDETVSLAACERGQREARRYFLLALASRRRLLVAPSVVAVGGLIASGKSTVADAIASELSAPVIDADRTRKHLLGIAPTQAILDASWNGAYDPAVTERVYAEVLRRAGAVLAAGRPVVLDASFRSAAMRHDVRRLAETYGVPFRFVECQAPDTTCRERLLHRAEEPTVSDGRLEIFDAFRARFEPVREIARTEHLVLDTSLPLESNLEVLRATLDVWPSGLVT